MGTLNTLILGRLTAKCKQPWYQMPDTFMYTISGVWVCLTVHDMSKFQLPEEKNVL